MLKSTLIFVALADAQPDAPGRFKMAMKKHYLKEEPKV